MLRTVAGKTITKDGTNHDFLMTTSHYLRIIEALRNVILTMREVADVLNLICGYGRSYWRNCDPILITGEDLHFSGMAKDLALRCGFGRGVNELTDRDSGDHVFANVHSPLEPTASFDIVVRGGRVMRLERHSREPQWVLFPPLAELHVPANRAFTAAPFSPSSLDHAIHRVEDIFRDFGEADYLRQTMRLFAEALGWGTSRVRTHADINRLTDSKRSAAPFRHARNTPESSTWRWLRSRERSTTPSMRTCSAVCAKRPSSALN